MKYVYTAWFRDNSVPPEDPDQEWPACFIIDGADQASAKDWGDRLARRYAMARGQDLLSSAAERAEDSSLPGVDALPVIREGQDADDEDIGW